MTIPSLDDAVLLTGFETGIDGTPVETAPVRASSWSLATDDPWQGSQFLRWAGDARPDGGDENAPFIPQRFLLAPTLSGSDVALDLRLFARCKITPGDKPKSVGTHYGRMIVEVLKGGEVIDTQIGAFLELAPAYPKSKGYWLEIGHMGIVPAGAETIRIYLEVQGGSTATIDWDEIKYLLFPYVDWGTPGVPDTGGATVDPTTGAIVQPSPAAKAAQRTTLPHSREAWTDPKGLPSKSIYTWAQSIDQLLPQIVKQADAAKAVAEQIPTRLGSPDGTLASIPKPKATVVRGEGGVVSRPIDDGYLVSLENVEAAEGGTLQRFTVDGKGRVIEAAPAVLADLDDVAPDAPSEGDVLRYDGTNWAPVPASDVAPVQSVNGQTGHVVIAGGAGFSVPLTDEAGNMLTDENGEALTTPGATTNDVPEGDRLYFTEARARAAAVADSIADGVTNVAPSQNAVFDALAGKANDADVVKLTGNQTVGGRKVFTSPLHVGSSPASAVGATQYVVATDPFQHMERSATPAAGSRIGGYISGAVIGGASVASGSFEFHATQAWSAGSAPTRMLFFTTSPGSTTRTARWHIQDGGSLEPLSSGAYNIGSPSLLVGAFYGNAYYVGANKVLGARVTGWSALTGTAKKGGGATYTAPTISNPPTQAEVQALANALQDAHQTIKALVDAGIAHGLIGT